MPSQHRHNLVIPPDAWAEIEKRTPPGFGGESDAATTMIRRYVALLAESRMRNRDTFTGPELAFLRDGLAGATTGQTLEDALMVFANEHTAAPIGVDVDDLYDRIRALPAVDKMGFMDSIERSRVAEAQGKRIITTPRSAG